MSDIEKVRLSEECLKRINDGGRAFLQAEVRAVVAAARSEHHGAVLGEYATAVETALIRHEEATEHFVAHIRETAVATATATEREGEGGAGPETMVIINSHEYVLFTGQLCLAWLWLQQGLAAHDALTNPDTPESEKPFYLGKISALDYCCHYELPTTLARAQVLQQNPQILNFAETDWL